MMRIAIRADASVHIGTGHVMRCLALADVLRDQGADIIFLCRVLDGDLRGLIEARGYRVGRLPSSPETGLDWRQDADACLHSLAQRWPEPADWLITDHYQLGAEWETRMRARAAKIMAIDDLAARAHDCDLLLDQNLYEGMAERYRDLLPRHCRQLLGPEHALLRPEFARVRAAMRERRGDLRRILVFFGGSDPTNETAKALEAVRQAGRRDVAVDVIVGSSNPHRHEVEDLCAALPNTSFHCQVDNMAEWMARADLAIGAGGSATWERCCLGLPAIVTVLADNQLALTEATARHGAVVNLGWADRLAPADYVSAFDALAPERLVRMSDLGMALVDGAGAKRVAQVLSQY